MSDPKILQQVERYTEVIDDALTVLERLALFFRGLRDPAAKARRLRHQAARLYRVALRADRNGYAGRAANLRDRAEQKWTEAQRLDPVDAELAALADRRVGNM